MNSHTLVEDGAGLDAYHSFLQSKVRLAESLGFEVDPSRVNPACKEHQVQMILWMVAGGRRACFASFGMGKTVIQLEAERLTLEEAGGRGLIVCPLGVRQEFIDDARNILKWDTPPKFVRSIEECDETGIYLTNYETVRDGKIDVSQFTVVSLDESANLRGFGGSKTFREFMKLFTGDAGPSGDRRGLAAVKYRFVNSACPSPNDYIELLAQSAFLGILDVAGAKTKYFKRDSTQADNLTLHPHMEREFWLWVSSWALYVQHPHDLGCPGDGYTLPELQTEWHECPNNRSHIAIRRDGQATMLNDASVGVSDSARVKRESLQERVAKVMDIVTATPQSEQIVIWCTLDTEQAAIEKALKAQGVSFSSLWGKQSLEQREGLMAQWKARQTRVFLSKPAMYGAGVNLQQSHTMIFAGIGFKFHEFIQAIHRIQRFGQLFPCVVHLIYSEDERGVRRALEKKWKQHKEVVLKMSEIIQEFGLSGSQMRNYLTRGMGVTRVEQTGTRHHVVNQDCILETAQMESDSVGLILTSIPFSSQYEYSPNYADFGHSASNEEFFRQMAFLTPQLLRVLQPGRIAAIHVKNRNVPMGMTGTGCPRVYRFRDKVCDHFEEYGFEYLGDKTIITDVVRENNQTYRLGYTEMTKDATKMGAGMPEYLLLFRKPPSDTSDGYADLPVVKQKTIIVGYECPECSYEVDKLEGRVHFYDEESDNYPGAPHRCPGCNKAVQFRAIVKPGYSVSRWQVDAHNFQRSSGDRPLKPEEFLPIAFDAKFQKFRDILMERVYSFEEHVALAEALEQGGQFCPGFMLFQPPSWHEDVWTNVARMRTLNSTQAQKGKEMHLCPLQFDIVNRTVVLYSNPGDVVYDPFMGIGTVPMCAIKLGRYGMGCELNPAYYLDGAAYCRAAEMQVMAPTLFDAVEVEDQQSLEVPEFAEVA